MAVSARLVTLMTAAALLAGCGNFAESRLDGPYYLDVHLQGTFKQVPGEAWNATVCADDTCKTFSPASCEADTGENCNIGAGMTITFQYAKTKDRPHQLSVRIVSDAGKLLYTDSKSNDCRLVQNICTAKFLIP